MPTLKDRILAFNEKADILLSSTFWTNYKKISVYSEFSGRGRGGGPESILIGPERPEFADVILPLRLFVGKSDLPSMSKLKTQYESSGLDPSIIGKYVKSLDSLESYLDQNTSLFRTNTPVTRREVFNVFMWGHYCHIDNLPLKERFEEWRGIEFVFNHYAMEFDLILRNYIICISIMKRINEEALRFLA